MSSSNFVPDKYVIVIVIVLTTCHINYLLIVSSISFSAEL